MIQKISEITKNSILQKSVYNLPDRPSEMGMNPTEIKKAFYKPITDLNNSVLTEIDRVIDESNNDLLEFGSKLDNAMDTLNQTMVSIDNLSQKSQDALQKTENMATTINSTLENHQTNIENFSNQISSINSSVENLNTNYNNIQNKLNKEKYINLTIDPSKWSTTLEYLPFKYYAKLFITKSDLTVLELLNTIPTLFAEYGFNLLYDVIKQSFYIVSLKCPTESIPFSFRAEALYISISQEQNGVEI